MQQRRLLSFLILTLSFVHLAAQSTLGRVEKNELTSKITGRQYRLFISLPAGYKANDTLKYPVLYVLDGNFMFPVMQSFQYLLSEVGEVRDVIIVGIGYNTASIIGSTEFRTPDYTPTKDTAFENMLFRDLKMKTTTGGADKFLQSLKQEIFPFIEKKYRTKDRGLAGHSFGALFGAYSMMTEPELFSKYLLSSISMFWDNEVILQKEKAFFQSGRSLIDAHVFVTVGAMEQFMDMIPATKRLTTSLREHNYKGLVLEERVLPNENHASAFLTSFNQGLRVLYKK